MTGKSRLVVRDVGLLDYESCLALQLDLHRQVAAGTTDAQLIIVEHPPVLTLGKNAVSSNLLRSTDEFRRFGVSVVATDRGGEVTAHEPGQLVAYPILRLADFGLGAKSYVRCLEQAVIQTLEAFGLKARTDAKLPGVWIESTTQSAKICAVGIRIKDRTSMHGIALNVANTLELFSMIVPCGIREYGVTSMSRVLDRDVTVGQVAPIFVNAFASALGAQQLAKSEQSD